MARPRAINNLELAFDLFQHLILLTTINVIILLKHWNPRKRSINAMSKKHHANSDFLIHTITSTSDSLCSLRPDKL